MKKILAVDPAYNSTNNISVISNTINMAVNTAAITVTAVSNAICEEEKAGFDAVAANAGTNPIYAWKADAIAAGRNSTLNC